MIKRAVDEVMSAGECADIGVSAALDEPCHVLDIDEGISVALRDQESVLDACSAFRGGRADVLTETPVVRCGGVAGETGQPVKLVECSL